MSVAQASPPLPPPEPSPDASTLAQEAPVLRAILGRLRRRAARQVITRAAIFGLAAGLGALLLAAALVVFKQSAGREVGWVLASALVIAGVVYGLMQARKVLADEVAAARALGSVSPSDASDLISAVELCREVVRPESNVSPVFVRAHLDRMSKIAARLDPRPALSSSPVIVALAAAAGVVLLHVILFSWGGQRLRESYKYLVYRPSAESGTLFAPEPIAGDVSLTYHYPAHMNRAVRTIPGTAGDITAPKGTIIDVTARADRDVQRAFAVVVPAGKPPQVIPLQVKGRELSGQLMISEPGEWRFRYAKGSGATVAEGPGRPITIEPDAFPEIRITAPVAELEVDGDESLTLAYEASDDYGLTQLDIVWNLGKGAPEQRQKLSAFTDLPRHQRGQMSWPLTALGLQPGDRVTYRLEVLDNDAVAGRKKGVSSSQILKVFSETEHHEEVLKKAQELWEKLINGMGDRLEEPPFVLGAAEAQAVWAKETRAKDETMTNVSIDLRSLARTLSDDKRAPQEVARALSHVGSRVGTAVGKTSTERDYLVGRPSASTQHLFATALAGEIGEEEKGVLYLEDLIDRRRLLDLAEMSRELQKGRQELARLVEQYKKAPNDETKRQVMAEVARLKERLHALYKRMQELAHDIQDEHQNQEAQESMQEGEDILSELDKVQEELSKGDSDDALKELEKVQKELEKMEKQFDDHAGDADEEDKKMGQQLQQLASDLLDVEAEQRAVKKETDSIREKEKQAMADRLKQIGAEFLQKQLDRLAKAKKEIDSIDPKTPEDLNSDGDQPVERLQERLSQLKQALEGNEFDEALAQAEGATQAERELQMRLVDEQRTAEQFPELGRNGNLYQQGAERAGKADRPLRDIAQDLDNLLRKASPAPSEQERESMSKLAGRQGQLQRQTEQLQQKLDQLGQQVPMFNPQQSKLLENAAESMDGARDNLEGADARKSSAQQAQALEKIGQLKKAMQEGQQNSGSSGGIPMPFAAPGDESGGDDGQGMDARNTPVVIPQVGENQAPAEFRKDILDAMKDKSPDKYKDRVRGYYEELVK